MTCILVPQNLIDHYFPLAAPHLKKALEHTPYTVWDLQSLFSACRNSQVFLFVDGPEVKNALVGQFVHYYQLGTVFYIMFLGGEGMDWRAGLKELDKWAKEHGAIKMTCNPRDGWAKYMKLTEIMRLCEIEVG